MTLWDHLENLCFHKKSWHLLSEEDKKTANGYLINRYISMEYKYLEIVNEIQSLNLPIQYMYNLYIGVLPKQKKFFKYIKKNIKETNGEDIKTLVKIFNISEREAKEYVNLLSKKQLDELHLQIEGFKPKKKKTK